MKKLNYLLTAVAICACTEAPTEAPVDQSVMPSEDRSSERNKVVIELGNTQLTSVQPVNLHVEFASNGPPEVRLEASAEPGFSILALNEYGSLEGREWDVDVAKTIRRPGATLSVGEQFEDDGRLRVTLLDQRRISVTLLDSAKKMALTGPLVVSCWIRGNGPTPAEPAGQVPLALDADFASTECQGVKAALGL